MMNKILLSLVLMSTVNGCLQSSGRYNLANPTKMNYLPEDLNEISGLDWINDSTLVAVQDEKGFLFFINPERGDVYQKVKFRKDGDYEGVAYAGNTYYVLKSNGTLISVKDKEIKKATFEACKTIEFEGLCFDAVNDRLLVACKVACGKKNRKKVLVYACEINPFKYAKEPVLEIDQDALHKNFKASGIALHPKGNWFLLSSVAKMLAEISPDGKVVATNPLNPFIFHQPEGITFSPGGTLYIANEKGETGPSIMTFDRQ